MIETSNFRSQVTPFVGVWIETRVGIDRNLFKTGHTLRGCVD